MILVGAIPVMAMANVIIQLDFVLVIKEPMDWIVLVFISYNLWSITIIADFPVNFNAPLFFSVCPAGSVLLSGDIPGRGQVGSNPSNETTISDCSDRCNSEPNCCSFEYSATEKKCNLNKDCRPTHDVYKDYSFCSKGNFSK